jgi:phage-related protein
MTTFSYVPDFGANVDETPNVYPVKFGDGYEQRISVGINTNKQIHNLTFSQRSQTEADAIRAFLRTAAAVNAFQWTPPGDSSPLVFVCRKWNRRIDKASLYTITCTFEQVYEPA